MKPDERLAELEKALWRLAEDNVDEVVLVEGVRDERALRDLGLQGPIDLVNRGASILERAEQIASHHRRVIVLVDWDRTGGRLARRLQDTLQRHGVHCDIRHRRDIATLTAREATTVEELPGFLRRLRERVGVAGRA